MRAFKVAMIQQTCIPFNPRRNTELGLEYIREAKANGADMVLFPECWITSYCFPEVLNSLPLMKVLESNEEFNEWQMRAISDDSEYLRAFRDIAKELSIGIVITSLTEGDLKPKNTAYLIDRAGQITLKYNKVHTCDFSLERYIESGEEFFVCQFDGIKIGIMICYDREYPESARELMIQGAEIILVPNDCGSMAPRLEELSVRARENNVGIAMVNPPHKNAGCSCGYNPMMWDDEGMPVDNTIVVAEATFEGIVYVEFDIDKIRDYRSSQDIGRYRKVKAYKNMLK